MDHLQKNLEISSYIIHSSEEEIKRIAIELHEGVGQSLYSIHTGIQFLKANSSNDELKAYAHEMGEILEKTIKEIRCLSVELHPPTLTTMGFTPAIKSYTKLYTSTYGILVEVMEEGLEFPLTETDRITLFRVCQEALGNIAKYADTQKAHIVITWTHKLLTVIIKDDGEGFDVERHKHKPGLAAMRRRMELIGGECQISSTIGKGTMIKFVLPLKQGYRAEEKSL